MLHVLKLHSLSWPPGGDSSGCIEVYIVTLQQFMMSSKRHYSSGMKSFKVKADLITSLCHLKCEFTSCHINIRPLMDPNCSVLPSPCILSLVGGGGALEPPTLTVHEGQRQWTTNPPHLAFLPHRRRRGRRLGSVLHLHLLLHLLARHHQLHAALSQQLSGKLCDHGTSEKH